MVLLASSREQEHYFTDYETLSRIAGSGCPLNLPNASLKNYHILLFWVFWDPSVIFGQAINTRRIGISLAICLLMVIVKFTITSFWGPKRPQKALGGLNAQCVQCQ